MKHKYNAKKTDVDNIKFDSKKEARYYQHLKLLQKSGDVLFFLRQPMFDLDGGVKYKADFLVFYQAGYCEVIDVKGYKTSEYIIKKKLVEDKYNIEIIEV